MTNQNDNFWSRLEAGVDAALAAANEAGGRLAGDIGTAAGLASGALTEGKKSELVTEIGILSAIITLLVILHYKLLGFEVLPLFSDPDVSISALQHTVVATIITVFSFGWVMFRRVSKTQDGYAGESETSFNGSWKVLAEAIAKRDEQAKTNAEEVQRYILLRVFFTSVFVSFALILALTVVRVWPLWIYQGDNYCRDAKAWEWALPQCRVITVTAGSGVRGDRSIERIHDVLEVGSLGSVSLFIKARGEAKLVKQATGAGEAMPDHAEATRIVLNNDTFIMSSGEVVEYTPVFPSEEPPPPPPVLKPDPYVRELRVALGLSDETLECLEQDDASKSSWVEFRFNRDEGRLCPWEGQCLSGGTWASYNRTSMQRLKDLLAANQDHMRALVIYGFTDAFGSAQGNLDLSTRRAETTARAVLDEAKKNPAFGQLASALGARNVIASGRGERWRYRHVPALSALGEDTVAIAVVCKTASPS